MGPFKKSNLKRKVAKKATRTTFLIVCEGEKTEPLYFEAFCLSSVTIRGTGFNTISLVDEAIRLKKKSPIKIDQVWCVFDRDNFEEHLIREAIQKANKNGIRIAYSNESFELWYLLHFNYMDCQLGRADYIQKLDNYIKPFGMQYLKNTCLFELVKDKQHIAIRNAKKLIENLNINMKNEVALFEGRYPFLDPIKSKPFTTVHDLVLELIRAQVKK